VLGLKLGCHLFSEWKAEGVAAGLCHRVLFEFGFVRLAHQSRANLLYERWRGHAAVFKANSRGGLEVARVVSQTIYVFFCIKTTLNRFLYRS
jgi:hypothetical protein